MLVKRSPGLNHNKTTTRKQYAQLLGHGLYLYLKIHTLLRIPITDYGFAAFYTGQLLLHISLCDYICETLITKANKFHDIWAYCESGGNQLQVPVSEILWWRHQMWPVNYPHKGQWRGALIFSLLCTWLNGWVSNREAGDSRRHCAHYDVIVMRLASLEISNMCIKESDQHYNDHDSVIPDYQWRSVWSVPGIIPCHIEWHYNGVIISGMASHISKPTIVCSTVYSKRRSKKTPKHRVTGLCEGKSP